MSRALAMRQPVTQRTVAGIATILVVATLVSCAVGLRLTRVQTLGVEAVLLDLQRRSAEAAAADLVAHAEAMEREVFGRISGAADAEALRKVQDAAPFVQAPFRISSDGTIAIHPKGSVADRSPLATHEVPPGEFENAARLLWRGAPLEDALQRFADIQESEALAPEWRLRALATLAAIEARAGDLEQASRRYARLFQESEGLLLSAARPSFLQVVLAASECHLRAGHAEEALARIEEAVDRLEEHGVSSTVPEERFFLARASSRLAGLAERDRDLAPRAAGIRTRLKALGERLVEFGASVDLARTLRDWLVATGRLDEPPARDEEPRHFLRELSSAREGAGETGGEVVLAAWRRTPAGDDRPERVVDGFRVRIPALESALTARLRERNPSSRLVAQVAPGAAPAGFVSLASTVWEDLPLQVGLPNEDWRAMVAQARKPFRLAGVLICALGVVLGLGVVVLWRGVRKELILARMKTEFVANVSHELKTPLALIRLFGETLLLDRVKDAGQREKYYRIITRESERLAHLISNVLSFASIEAGRKSYEMRPCEVGLVVRETYETYSFHLDEKGFHHAIEVDPDLPVVSADPDAVSQALINLLDNAVKYSPREKAVLVAVRRRDSTVRLSVSDRGVGIAPDDQPRVWDEYYRTREARALATRGSGLGLSLVRHIVEAHGGRVELESVPGKGSTFTLVFPAGDGKGSGDTT